jgi:hypothetical protein
MLKSQTRRRFLTTTTLSLGAPSALCVLGRRSLGKGGPK